MRDHLDNRHSVVHMFQKPSSANTILLTPWGHLLEQPDDPCFWGNSYPFCIQLEFYGKDLGWYTLFLHTLYYIAK